MPNSVFIFTLLPLQGFGCLSITRKERVVGNTGGYAFCPRYRCVISQIPPFAKYYLYDHLGNTRMVYHVECKLVQAGEPPLYNGVRYFVDQAIDYYPFGKVLREYILSGSSNTKYKSTGHERDKETSLDYRLARYYDSEIGRFLAVDPRADKYPDWNPYNYTLNNPINLIDPDGQAPDDPPLKPSQYSNPLSYVAEGFRQYFSAISGYFDHQAEMHANFKVSNVFGQGSVSESNSMIIENKIGYETYFKDVFDMKTTELIKSNTVIGNIKGEQKTQLEQSIGKTASITLSNKNTFDSKLGLSTGVEFGLKADIGFANTELKAEAGKNFNNRGGYNYLKLGQDLNLSTSSKKINAYTRQNSSINLGYSFQKKM